MIKQKGTILKFKKNLAIIMTSDCTIVSIRRQPGMDIGFEVTFNRNEVVHKKNKFVFSSQIVAGVAAVFAIVFIFLNSSGNNDAFAYVTVDSNTSIEFEVDKNNKILKINTFNADTNAILKEMDLKHQPIDVAIREVIKKSNSQESTVLISACLKEESNSKTNNAAQNNSEQFNKLINVCKSAVEDDVSEDTQSKVVETPYAYKELADKNEISLGRSIVYEKAKEQGVDIDIEEIRTKSFGEALKKVRIDDVGIVYDVRKVKTNPDNGTKEKGEPKEKMVPVEKKDPKPIVENNHPKPIVEPKNKIEDG